MGLNFCKVIDETKILLFPVITQTCDCKWFVTCFVFLKYLLNKGETTIYSFRILKFSSLTIHLKKSNSSILLKMYRPKVRNVPPTPKRMIPKVRKELPTPKKYIPKSRKAYPTPRWIVPKLRKACPTTQHNIPESRTVFSPVNISVFLDS